MTRLLRNKQRAGFTLIELLVVIAIIGLIVSGLTMVGNHVRTSAQIRNTKSIMTVLCTAMEEYQNAKKNEGWFKNEGFPIPPVTQLRAELGKSGFDDFQDQYKFDELQARLNEYLRPPGVSGDYIEVDTDPGNSDHPDGQGYLGNFSKVWDDQDDLVSEEDYDTDGHKADRFAAQTNIEFLYAVLRDVPACRELLNKLPEAAVVNQDRDGYVAGTGAQEQQLPLPEILDAWGHPLWYRHRGKDNFPVVISAGPDGMFDTADDIVSSEL